MLSLIFGPQQVLAKGKAPKRAIKAPKVTKEVSEEQPAIQEYLGILKKFRDQVCPTGTEATFSQLNDRYKEQNHYVPLLQGSGDKAQGRLDEASVQENLPIIDQKIEWLQSLQAKIPGPQESKALITKVKELQQTLDDLLIYKKVFDQTDFDTEKKRARDSSKELLQKLRSDWRALIGEVPFLLGFKYPVDLFQVRKDFDLLKQASHGDTKESGVAKIRSNSMYLYRKLIEDGAQNPDLTQNDRYLRASLNTLSFSIDQEQDIISENFRYDLNQALQKLQTALGRSRENHRERLKEWLDRTVRAKEFYTGLIQHTKKAQAQSKALLQKQAEHTYALENFVYLKQAETYQFWKKQNTLNQSLYVLETILFNEAGNIDGPEALERRDIIQVVLNRGQIPFYTQLSDHQELVKHFTSSEREEVYQYPWLNLMFRSGEFSFTLYFISSNLKVFCPDMDRPSAKLRKENLELSLEMLRKPNPEFKATRYFSRTSMIGNIDMAKQWDDFIPEPERAGKKMKQVLQLRKAYRNNQYKYYYSFNDEVQGTLEVIEIKDKVYTVKKNGKLPEFFSYRNPHLFKFFEAKKY